MFFIEFRVILAFWIGCFFCAVPAFASQIHRGTAYSHSFVCSWKINKRPISVAFSLRPEDKERVKTTNVVGMGYAIGIENLIPTPLKFHTKVVQGDVFFLAESSKLGLLVRGAHQVGGHFGKDLLNWQSPGASRELSTRVVLRSASEDVLEHFEAKCFRLNAE